MISQHQNIIVRRYPRARREALELPMSHLLWKYFYEDDVDRFQRLLVPAGAGASASAGGVLSGSSPSSGGVSPRAAAKARKCSGPSTGLGATKADVNIRDHMGLTLLLRACASSKPSAMLFVKCLLACPHIDMYAQDAESGWNALHRALYHGNVSIARLLLETERRDLSELSVGIPGARIGRLIKTKDKEGNSPFDLYNRTIGYRILKNREPLAFSDSESDSEVAEESSENGRLVLLPPIFRAS